MKIINSEKAPKAVGPYSQAIMFNNMLFVSGQLPMDAETGKLLEGSIEDKAKLVLNNVKNILEEAGMAFSNIIKSTIFVKDLNNFKKINEVYSSYFNNGIYPARETVEVARLPLDADLEISVIAALD
jgi:2-iminobutanoate/2-iminopropanoate deaminase